MTTTYDIGDRPVATATFRNAADVLTDPSAVTFLVRNPAGLETPYVSPHAAIVNTAVGVWTFTLPTPIDSSGNWHVRAKGTAGLITAGEVSFFVRSSAFVSP